MRADIPVDPASVPGHDDVSSMLQRSPQAVRSHHKPISSPRISSHKAPSASRKQNSKLSHRKFEDNPLPPTEAAFEDFQRESGEFNSSEESDDIQPSSFLEILSNTLETRRS